MPCVSNAVSVPREITTRSRDLLGNLRSIQRHLRRGRGYLSLVYKCEPSQSGYRVYFCDIYYTVMTRLRAYGVIETRIYRLLPRIHIFPAETVLGEDVIFAKFRRLRIDKNVW